MNRFSVSKVRIAGAVGSEETIRLSFILFSPILRSLCSPKAVLPATSWMSASSFAPCGEAG
jgi:hypothetical protein